MDVVVSAVAAVLAGLCLAAAGVLQQRSASRRPASERLSLRLMRRLVADRTWLLGILAAAVSYGFQAVALSFGPLTLVQPLVVSELLFAVPVSVRLRDLRLRRRDWCAVAAVVAGLALGIVAADPQRGQPVQPLARWVPALIAITVLVALSVAVATRVRGPGKATAFALAGACTMGLQSALYDATITVLRHRTWHVFVVWETYGLIAASLVGMYLIQNAFQSGPLAASTPLIDSTLPLVAIGLGVGIFGEPVRTSIWGLGGAAAGLLALLGGIIALDTSPVVRKEQRLEAAEQERTAQREQRETG
ncbi:DMT family transporter [Nocardioides terrisoli]|uniref:DMT family transporter n=1 Tax=Nocardioides terrisoli TaxID=3388267 RepID=UPI00287BA789|nr:DMT family transporter [Nocardioides marmorisolisilvae]